MKAYHYRIKIMLSMGLIMLKIFIYLSISCLLVSKGLALEKKQKYIC